MGKFMGFLTSGIGWVALETSGNLAVSMVFTLLLGAVMLVTYRLCHDSLTYNRKFNITLLMLAFISTVLLSLVKSNPMLSLGVLGSLSICRIRTNTKDPRDIGFVFWALCIGISSAVGGILEGIAGTVVLSVVLLVFHKTNRGKNKVLLVIRGEKPQICKVQDIFRQRPGSIVQSKNIFADSFEFVYEIQADPQEEEALMMALNHMDGIYGVNLLAPESKVA